MTTYTITLTDGTVLTTLVSQQIDTTHTSLTLWGQGTADYGQYLHDDLVHLLENAANTTAPTVPLTGQLWYDTGNQLYRSWNGTAWIPLRPDVAPNDAGTPTISIGGSPSIVALMSSGVVVAATSNESVSFGSLPATISYRNTSYSLQSRFPNGLAAGITLAHSLEPALDDDSDTLVTSSWVQRQGYLTTSSDDGGTISAAMLPVVEAATTAEGLALLASTPGAPGVFTNTQMNYLAQFLMGGVNPTEEFESQQQGNNSSVPLTAGILIPESSTVHEGTAIFACANNASTVTEGVGGTFFSRASADNTAGSFGINVLVTDQGYPTQAVVGCEWDIGAANLSTWAVGNNMIAVFPNGTPTRSTGYQVSANSVEDSIAYPWQVAYASAEGAATIAFEAGPLLNGLPSASQPISFYSIDPSGTLYGVDIQSVAYGDGVINLVAQTEAGAFVNTGELVQQDHAFFEEGMTVYPSSGTLAQFSDYTAQVNTTTTGTTASGATSFTVASASGITSGQNVSASGPAIPAGVTVTSVSGLTIHISAATVLAMPSGTAVEFISSTNVGAITTDGSTVSYLTTSDHRLKDIIGPSSGEIIDGIPVYEGRYKGKDGPTRPMVLAHEVQAVAPFAVSGERDALTKEGAIQPQMVDFTALVPALIAKIHDHEDRIAALERSLAAFTS